jgi:heme exporter protein C
MKLKDYWWKWLGVLLVTYSFVFGFLVKVPKVEILWETIRNLFFHVSMWFAMMPLILVSCIASILYLSRSKKTGFDPNNIMIKGDSLRSDRLAFNTAYVAMFFGVIGIITGSIWAKATWGDWWTFDDAKLNGVALSMLMYIVYFIVRKSFDNEDNARLFSAIFNIFAFVMFMVFINVIPRLVDSIHPGQGGNPGFSSYEVNNTLRLVFYPGVLGWNIIGFWIVEILMKHDKIKLKKYYAY